MSWAGNKKYTVPFMSLNGTSCRVDIYERDYQGDVVTTLTGAAEPVVFEENSNDDLLDVVRTKTGYLNLIEKESGELDGVLPVSNIEMMAEVWTDSVLIFYGYLQAQQFQTEWEPSPRKISIPIVSPLGVFGETYLNPIITPGNQSLGVVMQEICEHFQYDYISVPSALLLDNQNPMQVFVNNRVLSPYNENYGFGEENVFSPISYTEFIEAFCNLYGLISHDSVYKDGNYMRRVLQFTKFDYNGNYLLMGVPDLDDPNYEGSIITSESLTFGSVYSPADNNGNTVRLLPIGRLNIDHGDYLEDIGMNLRLASLGSSPAGRVSTLVEIGKVLFFIPLSLADGGEFNSDLLNSTNTAPYTNYASQGNMVRTAGDGSSEMIDLSFQHEVTPISNNPLLEYTFSKIPRTAFNVVMRTVKHENQYRFQVKSGNYYLANSGSDYVWTTTETILNRIAADENSGEYVIANIPPITNPVRVRIYQADGMRTYWGDPITELKLSARQDPLSSYYDMSKNPVRTIKTEGMNDSKSITMLFHDYIDNPGRIIGGELLGQNNYSYLFSPINVLNVRVKQLSFHDQLSLYNSTFSIDGANTWRLISFGCDVWNDDFILKFMRT